ncbi:hypothetical protein SAMN04488029_1813 [Reichenbachiella faecimaris]|uniref:CarboxypepD_reg-like domain-containing protein n=1 Tax=Reichenbachiella faecimaris TaxID=692418 RepID=A0A1W2GBJ7_REIFA|nr:hypothetical protein [Reichenbachiella faecimaris]SMD34050.1 hypothetical protein SAMN04488029_1813 [Reichenbachiella faecimaris]
MKLSFVSLLILSSLSSLAQEYYIQVQNAQSGNPIPYAHISSSDKLVTITDHFGRARIPRSSDVSYKISCIGYRLLTFSDQLLSVDEMTIIKLNPDEKILDAVTITPTTLEDMIKEVYDNIPNAYITNPHLLKGELIEQYMDTLGHANINSCAKIQVQKESYTRQHKKGEVKIDSLSRIYDVISPLYTQIHAGAHIPHRFDFVMKREEFINPLTFNKYNYEYLGEFELNESLVDVIGFEPNPKSLIEGQFAGKIYLDMKEKVFLKGEYHYTQTGIFSNPESRWVDRRQFITEYKPSENGWYFAYTWDEAVRESDNFLLSQYFKTKSIDYDTAVNWGYEEKIHFHDIVEKEPADTLIVNNEMQLSDSIPQVAFIRTSTGYYRFLSKIEAGYGIKFYSLNPASIHANGVVDYQGNSLLIDESTSMQTIDIGLYYFVRYQLKQNVFFQFGYAENFWNDTQKRNWDLGMLYRLSLKSLRPSNLNVKVSYTQFVSQFRFDKRAGLEPYFQQRHHGILGGLGYEIRLNGLFKLGLEYNYFHYINTNEKFYLKEKYGLFNLFSKKHDYDSDLVGWEVNGESQSLPVNIFDNHSFDLTLIIALDR